MPRPSNPVAAFRDFAAAVRNSSREQMIGGALAILSTIIIVILFLVDSQVNTAPKPTIIYVEQYGPKRTDADIKRDQVKDQKQRSALQEERKRQFRDLEKKLGM